MAKKYSGGIGIATGFKIQNPNPVADYMVVEYKADLTGTTLSPFQFTGMTTYVLEDQNTYVLKNGGWEIFGTVFTGGTISGQTNFTGGLSANTFVSTSSTITTLNSTTLNSSAGTFNNVFINGGIQSYSGQTNLSGQYLAGSANGFILAPISGITGVDTFTTGFTYSPTANTITLSQNQGQANRIITINAMTGLTVNGILSATTLNSGTANVTTLNATTGTVTTLSSTTANLNTANVTTLNATGATITSLSSTTLNLGRIASYSGNTNLSGQFLSGTTNGFVLAPISGITGIDTFTTGFTYSPTANTITLSQNQGQANRTITINAMTGLTVNGTLSATTYLNLPISIQYNNLYSTGLPGIWSGGSNVHSIFFGQNAGSGAAGFDENNSSYSNFFGNQAGFQASGANRSNFFGYQAGYEANGLNYNYDEENGFTYFSFASNFFGYQAGYEAKNAFNSNFLGQNAGSQATNGTYSNFLGQNAGNSATNAFNSNFLGQNAGSGAAYANNSNFFGPSAGSGAAYANNSNFFGVSAGNAATNANNSNFFGVSAGNAATNATGSTFMGNQAGYQATNAYYSNFLGQSAGKEATNASYSNLFGYQAGFRYTDYIIGQNNIIIEIINNNIGPNNIIIGTNISLPDATENGINIGGVLFGSGTYSATSGNPSITGQTNGRIGINVVNPTQALHVSGNTLVSGNFTATTVAATTGNITTANVTTLNATTGTVTTLSSTTLNLGRIASYSGNTNLSGQFLSGTTNGFILAPISGITGVDTFVTGFTYSPTANTITLSQNQGRPNLPILINTMTGLTVNGILSATTLNSGTANVNTLNATAGTVTTLSSTTATLGTANIGTLNATGITVTNNVTASAFIGNLNGLASLATSATTALNATNVSVTNNTTGNGTYYLGFVSGITGNQPLQVDSTTLTFNPSTNTLTVANISGLTTSATTALNAPVSGIYSSGTITLTNVTGGTFNVTGLTTTDTFTTGFTYSPTANTITLSQNQGQANRIITINAMTGLTVNGILSATTLNSGTANINTLSATGATITSLSSTTANINTLSATGGTITSLSSTTLNLGRIASYSGNTNLSGQFLSGTTNGFVLAPISGITGVDTFVTGFTYSPTANTITLSQNQGQANRTITINVMSGLTVNGTLSATTYLNLPISIVDTTNLVSTGLPGAGAGNSTINSIFFGQNAGNSASDSNYSNFIGYEAGQSANDAGGSNFFGYNAGKSAINANKSNFLGQNAGSGATSASNSNFMGYSAGNEAIGANNSNFFGQNAGSGATDANGVGYFNSNFFGKNAGFGAINANHSNFFGENAGYLVNGGPNYNPDEFNAYYDLFNSNFFGKNAGYLAKNAYQSNFFGESAGSQAINASGSNFLGIGAGSQATNASGSNFLGASAGNGAFNAGSSNFLGINAGNSATDASNSNFMGIQAGYAATGASSSNFLGYDSGYNAINANNSNFFGSDAGKQATNARNSNFIGKDAGNSATGASYSNFFGYNVGYGGGINNSIGSNNIIIGTNISLPNNTSNSINIGGVLFGSGTYSATSGNPSITGQTNGRIGINVVNPTQALHVSGNTLINGSLTANTISATTGNITTANVNTLNATGGTVTSLSSTTLNLGRIASYSGLTNLTGQFLSGTSNGFVLAPISGITGIDTFVTGFTYSPITNTITLSQNQGRPELPLLINTMSGLTVSDLTANRLVYTTSGGKLVAGTASFDGASMILPAAGSLSVGTSGLTVGSGGSPGQSGTGDVVINGSLTVFGASVSAFTSQLYVEDSNITLNFNPTGSTVATSLGAGWTIQDGNGAQGGSVNFDVRAMNTFTGITASNIPNITEYVGSTGYANRAWVTQLNDVVIRSNNVSTPNGVRLLAEFDVLDGGQY